MNLELPKSKYPTHTKHQIKSSLFALALTINQSCFDNSTKQNTHLLKLMFGKKNKINGLSLVNFGILDGNIKFDFSDLELENCYFKAYDSFWECKFNERTRFIKCGFFNMPEYSRSNSRGITRGMFKDPRNDLSFDEYFSMQDQSKESKRGSLKQALTGYFRIFYNNGMIYEKDNKSFVRSKYNSKLNSILSIDVIESVLKEYGVLSIKFDNKRKEDVATISHAFKEDFLKFLQEGVETIEMKNIIDSMLLEVLT